jgi:hypothetical protein
VNSVADRLAAAYQALQAYKVAEMQQAPQAPGRLRDPTTGWLCPRCGNSLAPWVPVCTCNLETRVTYPERTPDGPVEPWDPLPPLGPTTTCGLTGQRPA